MDWRGVDRGREKDHARGESDCARVFRGGSSVPHGWRRVLPNQKKELQYQQQTVLWPLDWPPSTLQTFPGGLMM